jgi:isocitrate lyase
MGGKVLVPTAEHVHRLQAARLQCDVMGTDTLIVARTDAQAANLLDSNIDERDQWQILGISDHGSSATVSTLSEAVEAEMREMGLKFEADKWAHEAQFLSHRECRILAADSLPSPLQEQLLSLGTWDAERARTKEGYYRTAPSVKACIRRGLAYAPYSDLLWMETAAPNLDDAKEFAQAIHEVYPNKMLTYNLSPSFNW